MADEVMHRTTAVSFDSVRSGLWLVIDLIDDLRDYTEDDDFEKSLVGARNRVMDTLVLMRHIEHETLQASHPYRLRPGAPAA